MKRRRLVITIGVVLLTVVLFGFLAGFGQKQVLAQIKCPSHMNPVSQQCYDYLNQQLQILQKQRGAIQQKLKEEDYQQLSLQEKINYINAQIIQTEEEIKSLQIEIAAAEVEIGMLEKEIKEKGDIVSVLKQEINKLSDSVHQRITESYKNSFINQFEFFLDIKNLSSALRKSKYLATTRKQDRVAVEKYANNITELKKQEDILSRKKETLEEKRDEVEGEKLEIAQKKEELNSQKGEQARLLAESKVKGAQLAAQLQSLIRQTNDVTTQIQAIAMTLYRTGQIPIHKNVVAGEVLGYQGHTGFSYGSHLHFNLSGVSKGPFELGYFTNRNGFITNGSVRAPLKGGGTLTQDYHNGYSIDLVGTYSAWSGQKYHVKTGEVCCKGSLAWMGCIPAGSYNLNGEGTPVVAIKAGKVTRVQTDPCGGKYVIVDHGGGELSMYLHLR